MPAKILVVDDEEDVELIIRQSFRRQMREGKFHFSFAHNGQEALEAVDADPEIDVVVTDINMPVMDGLTLLNKLQERNLPTLRALIVSAYGDMENIRTAMNRGAFDFLTKPLDLRDLEVTLQKTLDDIAHLKSAQEAREQLTHVRHELDVASRIQTMLLRDFREMFGDRSEFDLRARMIPARSVGGDFYDAFPLDENRIGILIGDVTGKGMPAALFMAVSITSFRTISENHTDPHTCLRQINDLLLRDSSPEMFVTVFYGILDRRTGEFRYSNGGHNPPYLLRADGSLATLQAKEGILMGMFPNCNFSEESVQLGAGDRIFLFTDGVTEAMNPEMDLYSEERLERSLTAAHSRPPDGILDAVLEGVRAFAGGAEQSDDLTMLLLRYNGATGGGTTGGA